MRFAKLTTLALALAPFEATAQAPLATLETHSGWWTDAGTHMAAFEFEMAEGWKTYWRSPGDSGIPPSIDWGRSRNIADVKIHWPTPGVYTEGGITTIGYEDRLVLPLEITPRNRNGKMVAAGKIDIGVCADVCVPVAFRFKMSISETGNGDGTEIIRMALQDQPDFVDGSEVSGLSCRADALSDGMAITARLDAVSSIKNPTAVLEYGDPEVWVSAPELQSNGGTLSVRADFVPPDAIPFSIDRSQITLTLIGSEGALEIKGCPGTPG